MLMSWNTFLTYLMSKTVMNQTITTTYLPNYLSTNILVFYDPMNIQTKVRIIS